MKPSEDLFELIKSLTPNEKGFFKKYMSRYSSEKKSNYSKLFDLLDKQTSFNEKELKEKLKGEKFLSYFEVAKNYLHEQILNCLESISKSNESEIMLQLSRVEVLFKKGLFKQCEKILTKAYKDAVKYEYPLLVLLINQKQLKLARTSKNITFRKQALSTFKSTHDLNSKLFEKYSNYSIKKYEIGTIIIEEALSNSEIIEKKYSHFINSIYFKDESLADTPKLKNYFYSIKSIYFNMIGEFEKALDYAQKRLDLFIKNPELIKDSPLEYLNALDSKIAVLANLNRLEDAVKECEKIKNDIVNIKFFEYSKNLLLIRTITFQIRYYIGSNQLTSAIKLVPEVEQLLSIKDYDTLVNYKNNLILAVSHIFFCQEDYKKAIEWSIKLILTGKEILSTPYIICSAKLLNLKINYELGNFEGLANNALSTKRYLIKFDYYGEVEKLMIHFFSKCNPINKVNFIEETYLKIKEMPELKLNKSIAYTNFYSWLKSKVENKKYLEVLNTVYGETF